MIHTCAKEKFLASNLKAFEFGADAARDPVTGSGGNLVHDGKQTATSPRRRPYRQLPHTADRPGACPGKDSPELFENAGRALSATLTDRRYLRRRATRTVSLTADDREALLVDWLNHLLYLFDQDGFLAGNFKWSR